MGEGREVGGAMHVGEIKKDSLGTDMRDLVDHG